MVSAINQSRIFLTISWICCILFIHFNCPFQAIRRLNKTQNNKLRSFLKERNRNHRSVPERTRDRKPNPNADQPLSSTVIVLSDDDEDDVIEIPLTTASPMKNITMSPISDTSNIEDDPNNSQLFYECRSPGVGKKPIYTSPFCGFLRNVGFRYTSTPQGKVKKAPNNQSPEEEKEDGELDNSVELIDCSVTESSNTK